MRHSVSCSSGVSLDFPTTAEYNEYKALSLEVSVKTYIKLRHKHGVWASNQDKYVPNVSYLRDWDSRRMELLAKFYLEDWYQTPQDLLTYFKTL